MIREVSSLIRNASGTVPGLSFSSNSRTPRSAGARTDFAGPGAPGSGAVHWCCRRRCPWHLGRGPRETRGRGIGGGWAPRAPAGNGSSVAGDLPRANGRRSQPVGIAEPVPAVADSRITSAGVTWATARRRGLAIGPLHVLSPLVEPPVNRRELGLALHEGRVQGQALHDREVGVHGFLPPRGRPRTSPPGPACSPRRMGSGPASGRRRPAPWSGRPRQAGPPPRRPEGSRSEGSRQQGRGASGGRSSMPPP